MTAALSLKLRPPGPHGCDGPPPDLRAPAGPPAAGIALIDALERLREGVEIFGPPLLVPDARGARGDGPVHVAALRGDAPALLALAAAGDNDAAVDELLELFRRDREWNEGAAKTQLLKLIDSLGPKDPLAGKARRRLGSMILC